MKYQPERDLELAAVETKSSSPTALANWVLNKRNVAIKPEAITMYLMRHPETKKTIEQQLLGMTPSAAQAADSSILENGNFRAIPSVRDWIDYLRGVRRIKEDTISQLVYTLKQICAGKTSKFDLCTEGKWCLKHPDRLSFADAQQVLSLFKEKGYDLYTISKTLKSFLTSKGITEGSRIMVGKPRSYGRFAQLYVSEETTQKVLSWVRETYGLEPYVVDMIMYKKAHRINEVLNATFNDVTEQEGVFKVTFYCKGLERKYGERGKAVTRVFSGELLDLLKQVMGERKEGAIFQLDEHKMSGINTEAIKLFAPEILLKYGHVNANHLFRHLYAQHNLRKTHWNTGMVANCGNWTTQALEESYGKAPPELVEQWITEFDL